MLKLSWEKGVIYYIPRTLKKKKLYCYSQFTFMLCIICTTHRRHFCNLWTWELQSGLEPFGLALRTSFCPWALRSGLKNFGLANFSLSLKTSVWPCRAAIDFRIWALPYCPQRADCPIITPPTSDWSYHTSPKCWLVLSYLPQALIVLIIPPPRTLWWSPEASIKVDF